MASSGFFMASALVSCLIPMLCSLSIGSLINARLPCNISKKHPDNWIDDNCFTVNISCATNESLQYKFPAAPSFYQPEGCSINSCRYCYYGGSGGKHQFNLTLSMNSLAYQTSYNVMLPTMLEIGRSFHYSLKYSEFITGNIPLTTPAGKSVKIAQSTFPNWLKYFDIVRSVIVVKSLRQLAGTSGIVYLMYYRNSSNSTGFYITQYNITIINVNEPPKCFVPDKITLHGFLNPGSTVAVFNCSDPDEFQKSPSSFTDMNFTISGDIFSISGNNITLKKELKDELGTTRLVHFLASNPQPGIHTNYTITVNITNKKASSIFTSIKIKRPWDDTLMIPQSGNFQSLASKIKINLMQLYHNNSGFIRVDILKFRPGSVISYQKIVMADKQSLEKANHTLRRAVQSGNIGNLIVNSSYFSSSQTGSLDIVFLNKTSERIIEGNNATFRCVANAGPNSTAGQKPITFSWFLNDTAIVPLRGARITTDIECQGCLNQTGFLHFRPIKLSDAGRLTCRAQADGMIRDSRKVQIRVSALPQVRLNVTRLLVSKGDSIVIGCQLVNADSGTFSNATIVWRKNGKQLNGGQVLVSRVTASANYSCYGYHSVVGYGRPKTAEIIVITKDERVCPQEKDAEGTEWSKTAPGREDEKSCLNNYTGLAKRKCSNDGQWEDPDYNSCVRESIQKVNSLLDDIKDSKEVTSTANVLKMLANATDEKAKELQAGDLAGGLSALEKVNEINSNTIGDIKEDQLQNFYQVASNLLAPKNKKNWKVLNKNRKTSVTSLMRNVDAYGAVIVKKLTKSSEKPIVLENLIAEITKSSTKNEINFPSKNFKPPVWMENTGAKIPAKTLLLLFPGNDTVGLSVVIFRNISQLLPSDESANATKNSLNKAINTNVLAISTSRKSNTNLPTPIELRFKYLNQKTYENPECSFWDFNLTALGKVGGGWSGEGCAATLSNEQMTVCTCNHLTNFAVLMSPKGVDPDPVLSIISIVGCAISIIGATLTILIYAALWKALTSEGRSRFKSIILINLCLEIIIAYIIFLAGVTQTENETLCTVVAALLHYFFLVVFFTMLAEAIELVFAVIIVFEVNISRTRWLLLPAWIIPAVIVGISLGATQLEGYGNENFCWLSVDSGLIWAFVGPVLAIILVNAIVAILVIRALLSSHIMRQKKEKIEKATSGLRAICILTPVLGFTWIFGVFSVNREAVVVQYLFAISTSLQGLFIFLVHCLLSRQVRSELLKKHREYNMKLSGTFAKSTEDNFTTKSTTRKKNQTATTIALSATGEGARQQTETFSSQRPGSESESSSGSESESTSDSNSLACLPISRFEHFYESYFADNDEHYYRYPYVSTNPFATYALPYRPSRYLIPRGLPIFFYRSHPAPFIPNMTFHAPIFDPWDPRVRNYQNRGHALKN